MNTDDSELRELLRRLSRQVGMAIGLSSACLALLVFVLLFPLQAEKVSLISVNIQEMLQPFMGGVIGGLFALLVVFFAAAYVISRVASTQAPDLSK